MDEFGEEMREKLFFGEMIINIWLPCCSYKQFWQITVLVPEENFQISPRIWLQIGPMSKLELVWAISSLIEDA